MIERYTTCNNPNRRCTDPEQRHGPYWQLSCKHAGKTVSRVLSAEDAARYQEWIVNRRRLDATLKEMNDLSRQAGEYILAGQGRPFHGPERPRSASQNDPKPRDITPTRGHPRVLRAFATAAQAQKPRVTRHFLLVLK